MTEHNLHRKDRKHRKPVLVYSLVGVVVAIVAITATIVINDYLREQKIKEERAALVKKLKEETEKITSAANNRKAEVNISKDGLTITTNEDQTKKIADDVNHHKISTVTYKWSNQTKTFKEAKDDVKSETYTKADGSPIILQDLIVDQLSLDQIWNLTRAANITKENYDSLMATGTPSADSAITYTPKKLTFNDLKLSIPFKKISHLVKPQYLAKGQLQTLDPNKKYISITFDDGPNPATTPQVLQILKEKNVTSTFFMLGQMAAENPTLAKQVAEGGHDIANHSWDHADMVNISADAVKDEFAKADKAIFDATGVLPTLVRPPYGAVNASVAQIIGRPIIQWDIDSEDWKSKNAGVIMQRLQSTAFAGGIILMHDIQPATVEALPGLIDWLRGQGYEILPVSQLLDTNLKPQYQYFSATDFREVK
jgi:peptidoglycan/xylan/chitin deacetylase (PgdA/CDA1 family)/Tfp pilus assembly protein PilE